MGMLYRDCSYQPIYWKLGRDEICRRVSHGTRSNQQSFMFLPSALSKTLWLSTHICPTSTIFPYSNELRSFPCLEYLSGDLDTERTQRLLHGARKASFPIYVLGRPLRSNITSFDGMWAPSTWCQKQTLDLGLLLQQYFSVLLRTHNLLSDNMPVRLYKIPRNVAYGLSLCLWNLQNVGFIRECGVGLSESQIFRVHVFVVCHVDN